MEIAPDLRRTCTLAEDLAWVPGRGVSWVRGAVLAGASLAIVALIAAGLLVGWRAGCWICLLPIAGGAWPFAATLGDRLARRFALARLQKVARGELPLGALRSRADGELVHVRGRVRTLRTIRGLVGDAPAVYRRTLVFDDHHVTDATIRYRWVPRDLVDEEAVDFMLASDDARDVRISVAEARLLEPDPVPGAASEDVRARLVSRGPVTDGWLEHSALLVAESLLRDGDEVEVVGFKARAVDPTLQERLARETPFVTVLESGPGLPLLIRRACA